jgi:hypothetical protein
LIDCLIDGLIQKIEGNTVPPFRSAARNRQPRYYHVFSSLKDLMTNTGRRMIKHVLSHIRGTPYSASKSTAPCGNPSFFCFFPAITRPCAAISSQRRFSRLLRDRFIHSLLVLATVPPEDAPKPIHNHVEPAGHTIPRRGGRPAQGGEAREKSFVS